MLKYKIIKK